MMTASIYTNPPLRPLDEVMRQWFDRVVGELSSLRTTDSLKFTEGVIQAMWRKDRGHIVVKYIRLDEEHIGKGLFTAACRRMLEWPEVVDVELESVLRAELVAKLEKIGWKATEQTEHNLFLTLV